jgi:SAM-dependent methyltransferase
MIDMESKQGAPVTDAERVLLRYLEEAPTSYSLWRSLEYQALKGVDFREPLLDLGCGEGLFSDVLFEKKATVGMDISYHEVNMARAYGKHEHLIAADGCRLPFRDGVFETVFSNCVIEHIPGVDALVAEVFRVLRPGGKFVTTVPGERFTPNLFFSMLFMKLHLRRLAGLYGYIINKMLGHVHKLSHEEWAAKFESAGFRIERIEPILSAAAVRIFDLGIYSAYRSYLNRIFFHRWVILSGVRKRFWAPRLFKVVRHLLSDKEDLGGGLVLIGRKPGM